MSKRKDPDFLFSCLDGLGYLIDERRQEKLRQEQENNDLRRVNANLRLKLSVWEKANHIESIRRQTQRREERVNVVDITGYDRNV